MFGNLDIVIAGTIVFDIFVSNYKEFPSKGQAVELEKIPFFTGGCGANPSVILSKLGAKVSLIGALGDDLSGNYILNYLNQNNVDTSLIKVSSKLPTSTSILFINQKKERSYFHSVGASKEISIGSKEFNAINQSKIFHIGGVNLLPSLDGKPMAQVLKKAKLKNIITSIDLAWDVKNKWMKNLKASLPFIDILMGNEFEIKALTQSKNLKTSFKILHEAGVKIVVVKLGSKGSVVSKDFVQLSIPSFKVKPKDSTGAGDAFAAGFLFGILKGFNLYDSAKLGNYIGALVTTELGSTSSVQKFKSFDVYKILKSEKLIV
ncbi:MAG: carbohydrate kinase family protein [Ignavibacteria bacterium]